MVLIDPLRALIVSVWFCKATERALNPILTKGLACEITKIIMIDYVSLLLQVLCPGLLPCVVTFCDFGDFPLRFSTTFLGFNQMRD